MGSLLFLPTNLTFLQIRTHPFRGSTSPDGSDSSAHHMLVFDGVEWKHWSVPDSPVAESLEVRVEVDPLTVCSCYLWVTCYV